jgi:hypothetical protein
MCTGTTPEILPSSPYVKSSFKVNVAGEGRLMRMMWVGEERVGSPDSTYLRTPIWTCITQARGRRGRGDDTYTTSHPCLVIHMHAQCAHISIERYFVCTKKAWPLHKSHPLTLHPMFSILFLPGWQSLPPPNPHAQGPPHPHVKSVALHLWESADKKKFCSRICDQVINVCLEFCALLNWHVITKNYILTLIRMAGGIYDFRNFEQIQLKMVGSKNIFFLDLFFMKCIRIISC